MITTTPIAQAPKHGRKASASRLPSRPTTPLRPASRTSFRASQTTPRASDTANAAGIDFPLSRLEPAFSELSEAMADLEANFMHLQLLNESIARFNDNFAAFLYGLNMTAFCVDFPEAPISQSFTRHGSNTCQMEDSPFRDMRIRPAEDAHLKDAPDTTFMTGDTSFVENPPMSNKPSNKFTTATTSKRGATRGGAQSRGAASTRGKVPVAGVDENGRRTTRLPSGNTRGRGSTTRAWGRH
ncbi:hypothetical protein AMS68_006103 [Peltaster fructicola]|uniref:DASH complex subunit DAM1 n=1 Tax=Peltaster fructicola TaxID=286661 RepID=A0A6H0Y0Y1_9PEZI|nr:hypothetical protein AMS68_006103 [Peltaster fructicola]